MLLNIICGALLDMCVCASVCYPSKTNPILPFFLLFLLQNEIICIHRHWVPDSESESELYPQNLHLQFHGREIHSVCFIAGESDYSLDKKHRMLPKSDWIATGCEDGTVRLTR